MSTSLRSKGLVGVATHERWLLAECLLVLAACNSPGRDFTGPPAGAAGMAGGGASGAGAVERPEGGVGGDVREAGDGVAGRRTDESLGTAGSTGGRAADGEAGSSSGGSSSGAGGSSQGEGGRDAPDTGAGGSRPAEGGNGIGGDDTAGGAPGGTDGDHTGTGGRSAAPAGAGSGGSSEGSGGVESSTGGDAGAGGERDVAGAGGAGGQPGPGPQLCPDLSDPDNGTVAWDSPIEGGTSATYRCNLGYVIGGSDTRFCRSDGTWSGSVPSCDPVDCGPLADPEGGTVSLGQTTLGAVASYSCGEGHLLSGMDARTCESSGQWSGSAPTCPPRDCGTPASSAHATVDAPLTTYGSTATYGCVSGYVMSGEATRTCDASGDWSGNVPSCSRMPSCQGGLEGAGYDCGASGDDDCCASSWVPGGSFYRNNDASHHGTVSRFRLDKYPVTAGRFRAFLQDGRGTKANPPAAGDGEHPRNPGTGWDSEWDYFLVDEGAQPVATLGDVYNGGDDHRPINYVTWPEAFAFCAWDGGRLPTDMEYNFAAAGGDEQRTYPWGDSDPGTETTHAIYHCYWGPTTSCEDTSVLDIAPVGSAPDGIGKWGHMDLAGNVYQWMRDMQSGLPDECNDCINLTGSYAAVRGSQFDDNDIASLSSSWSSGAPPTGYYYAVGFRCARDR
jgi:sulfatase modifying factor 1